MKHFKRCGKIPCNIVAIARTDASSPHLCATLPLNISEKQGLEGIIVETGCALGGSTIVITRAKEKKRKFFVYDVFEQIPGPTDHDGPQIQESFELIKRGGAKGISGDEYYGYQKNLYEKLIQNFKKFDLDIKENNVFIKKGLFQETLHIDEPVVLAHIDCDFYEAVFYCLSQIEPHLVANGTIVVDDYYEWPGCRKSVDEYFKDRKGYTFLRKSRLHIVKGS